MTRLIFLSLFWVLACTLVPSKQEVKSIQMHELWKNNAIKEDIVQVFGKYSDSNDNDIVYRLPPPQNGIDSAHFFNSKGQLEEQFVFVSKAELEDFLKYIPCAWKKKSSLKSLGHSVGEVEFGLCDKYGISYEYSHPMHLYEIRWKK